MKTSDYWFAVFPRLERVSALYLFVLGRPR